MGKEFISGTALDPRLDEHLLTRLDDIRRIARELNEGHYYLILAPAGSGRTTTLKAIERHLRDRTSVLLLRPTDLSLASGREFFQSICEASDAALLESSGFEAGASRVPLDAADRPFDDWLITRTPLMRRRLIYLFDDIDLIPPNLLARLADIAHGLYNERNARPTLNRVGFVFAGSISLRYLTLKDNPNVSPFNVCSGT